MTIDPKHLARAELRHKLLEERSAQGSVEHQFKLGMTYYKGLGVAQNITEGIKLIEQAAQGGYVKAQSVLGIWAIEDDPEEAKYWLHLAAAQGDTNAFEKLVAFGLAIEDNNELKPTEIPPKSFVPSKTTFERTSDFLTQEGIPEADHPEVAAPIAQIIEQYHRDPEALKTKLPAITDMLATGAATPEASHAQRVTSRRASASQELPASVYPDIPPPPTEAPAKYAQIDPGTGQKTRRKEGVVNFMLDAYAPWIVPDPEGGTRPVLMLQRRLIEQLDEDCDKAISQWSSNHKGEFPIKIARKNAVEPVSAEEVREARRKVSWADYQKRRQAQQTGALKDG